MRVHCLCNLYRTKHFGIASILQLNCSLLRKSLNSKALCDLLRLKNVMLSIFKCTKFELNNSQGKLVIEIFWTRLFLQLHFLWNAQIRCFTIFSFLQLLQPKISPLFYFLFSRLTKYYSTGSCHKLKNLRNIRGNTYICSVLMISTLNFFSNFLISCLYFFAILLRGKI